MIFDYDAWRFWIQVAALVGSLLAAGYTWWMARAGRITAAIRDTRAQTGDLEGRVAGIERDLRHMPTQQDLNELANKISQLHGDIMQLSGTMAGVSRAVDLMNQYLIERER